MLSMYSEKKYNVSLILADRQFESIKNDIAGMSISMNITGQDYIRTLKERIRSIYNTLPFKNIPPETLKTA
jgi:hypothetical protein